MDCENNKLKLDIVKSKMFHLAVIFLVLLIQSVQAQNAPIVTNETFIINEHPANNFGSIKGMVVGTVTANDPDGDNLSYSITDGNTDGAFNINSSSGEISVANDDALDFETNPIFMLTIEVTDDEATPKSGTGTITVELNDISPNDLCTNAITIGVGTTVSGSTSDASPDTYIVSNCGANAAYGLGVWYHLAGNGETIILSTCSGDKYGFDTSLSVYSGSCTTELVCIAGNEDTGIKGECGRGGEQASLKFASELGVDYYIFLDGFGMLSGDFDLTTSSIPNVVPPANDNCQGAETLTVFPRARGEGFSSIGDNTTATASVSTTSCEDEEIIYDVWYTFNSGVNTQVEVETTSSFKFALYETCGRDDILCDDDLSQKIFSLDVEPDTDYQLRLWTNAEDDLGEFRIRINDGLNTAVTIQTTSVEISKYSAAGAVVTQVLHNEDEEDHAQLYSITGGNTEGIFAIDENDGTITVADATLLQASVNASFDLTVQAEDQGPGSLSSTGIITVNVIDNEAPAVDDQVTSLDENTSDGTPVISLGASDVDGDNLSYAIIDGNTGNAFAIDGAGDITVNDETQLNYETNPVFELKVEVTDDGPLTLSSTATVTISLNDINEAPVVLETETKISRYLTQGYSVGFVEFTDDDPGQSHTFEITDYNEFNVFAIDAVSGEITIDQPVPTQYIDGSEYPVAVKVTDDGSPVPLASEVTTITFKFYSNHSPIFHPVNFTIDENSSDWENAVWATDYLDNDRMTYSIVAGNDLNAFAMYQNGGIKVNDSEKLDFETQSSFNLTVKVQDDGAGSLTDSGEVNIYLNDINEVPVITSFTPEKSALVNEDPLEVNASSLLQNGEIIGRFNVEDPDDNDVISFSITEGNDQGIFGIDATLGALAISDASLLDPYTQPVHTLTVSATDGSLSSTKEITISLFLNDLPSLASNSFSVDENSEKGTVIASLTSADPHEFIDLELIGGNETNAFEFDENKGILKVNESSLFDFESTPQYFDLTFHLKTQGLGNLEAEEVVRININDVSEAAPVLNAIGDKTIDQEVELAFTVTASDEDVAPVLTYFLDDTSLGKGMSIGASSGVFSWTPSNAAVGDHPVVITVDDGLFSDSETITITVNDINEFAPALNTIDDQIIDQAIELSFAAVATDDDPTAVLTYSLDDISLAKGMNIGASSGLFFWTPISDQQGIHTVKVTVSDGIFSDSETIRIVVIGTNNFAPVLNTIGDQSTAPDELLTFTATATDADGATALAYSLDASSVSKGMSIDPVLGIFTWSPTAAQAGTHTVGVTVSDGTFSDSETITIAVILTVGVDDALKYEFVIYPNPVAGTLYLSLDNNYRGEVLVRVLSMSGEAQITRQVMKSEEKLRDQLDIVSLKAGAYLLEVRMPGSEKLVHRIIKE